MNESEWRSKLVKLFIQDNPSSFIWVNDVRYKAGFPDVYRVHMGRSSHFELKLCKGEHYRDQMTKLQKAVCNRLAKAGVRVSCLTYVPAKDLVHVKSFNDKLEYFLDMSYFNGRWAKGDDF